MFRTIRNTSILGAALFGASLLFTPTPQASADDDSWGFNLSPYGSGFYYNSDGDRHHGHHRYNRGWGHNNYYRPYRNYYRGYRYYPYRSYYTPRYYRPGLSFNFD
jgi:hypothetical protein